ncbi:lipase 1-like isoform X2 [Cylas formicarius]|nr:lipase 1-like isoform X2 [Cylas formicarius]
MFLFPGYGKGIGWYLADRDFDIWLLNTRGNYHSRKHRKWNPDKDPEFWNFSWHEVGVYDLPAAIDHILTVTNKSKLFYVGHSQGSTVYLVLTTQRPEYNDKIALGVNLAPSAFIGDNNYLLMELVGKHRLLFKSVMKGIGFHEVLPFNLNRLVRTLMRFVCSEINVFVDVCNIVFNFPDNTHQVDPATFQLIFSYVPAGCSLKQLNHYLQIVESNSFALYDYGRRENKKYYGQVKPPIYNLENITAPTAYFYGTHDVITKPEGIAKLISKTKNIEVYKIEQGFNHVDFLFSKNVIEIVNKPLYSMMKKYVVNID